MLGVDLVALLPQGKRQPTMAALVSEVDIRA